MPRAGDYVRIPQQEDIDEEDADVAGESPSAVHLRGPSASYGFPTGDRQQHRRTPSRGGPGKIDLSSIDNAFKKWTAEISQRVRRKKKNMERDAKKEIVFSVFQRVTADDVVPSGPVKTLDDGPPMTDGDFNETIANAVRDAIADGVHPKMISKGSSGSYFARKKGDGRPQIVGVFKPKDEEPYGHMNPKFTKWVHRTFFWWVGFGRACLIPNLSYISEAAASLLDDRLQLNVVPRTKLVSLSSPAFSYGWLDRNAYKGGKALPDKVGSMQTFMTGYQDASAFLREHPWPGRAISDTYDDASHRSGTAALKRCSAALGVMCGRIPEEQDDDDFEDMIDRLQTYPTSGSFTWTPAIQQEFREELEKLIILDYLMRNTDRGLDNFMIKFCEGRPDAVVNRAPAASPAPYFPNSMTPTPQMSQTTPSPSSFLMMPNPTGPSRPPEPSASNVDCGPDYHDRPHIHIAAIDNSLSFPHQHPKGWREFTYGWLFLPVSLIGRPFSKRTRDHFLPLLSDPEWWAETTFQLRKLHKVDDGFNERMFQRQMAVMKGQGWNIVQSLKHQDEGPLELTRRAKVMVWDEEVEVPVDATPEEIIDIVSAAMSKPGAVPGDVAAQPTLPRPPASPADVTSAPNSPAVASGATSPGRGAPRMNRTRSYSIGSRAAFRRSTDFPRLPFGRHSRRGSQVDVNVRPVPLSSKKLGDGAALGGATGVDVLEHLEKLDVAESSLNRVIDQGLSPVVQRGSTLFEAHEEDDVGEQGDDATTVTEPDDADMALAASTMSLPPPRPRPSLHVDLQGPRRTQTFASAIGSDEAGPSLNQLLGSSEDIGLLRGQHSKAATSDEQYATVAPRRHGKSITPGSNRTFDLSPRKTRIVIAERLETVDAQPFFSGW